MPSRGWIVPVGGSTPDRHRAGTGTERQGLIDSAAGEFGGVEEFFQLRAGDVCFFGGDI